MAADVDSDVPEWGAAFTFGRSRFADNVAGKFWIKNDPILQVACGDEHTALLTASGRLFTFGSNEWGQLGHGHTRAVTKPSCVKALKGKRATVVACGRSHTLVATAEGNVFAFGSNSEGQLGSADEQPVHLSPIRVQGLEGVTIKMLSGGADHSMALTDKGVVYVWGSGAEGQIGPEEGHIAIPTELHLESNIICLSAGYYHSAFVTVDGTLYTCGEGDSGKLGLPEQVLRKSHLEMHCVPGFSRKVVWVSCGGNHTIALTSDGKAYSFGNGFDGQLGRGSKQMDAFSPEQILFLESSKVARVSCGENHSAFLTDKGHMYTCGNGRHDKLGLIGVDDGSNNFVPTRVARFNGFQVQQVACGGCHTLVLAVKQESVFSPHPEPDQTGAVSSAREKRRQKSTKLPPISSNKNESFSPTLKAEYRQRLPNLSKGAIWYVPLVDSTIGDQYVSDDEDEVLTQFEGRRSLLDQLERDLSIRHVDSDIDSDSSEISELNRTHTLIRVDNTILARPTIPADIQQAVNGECAVNANMNGTDEMVPVVKHSETTLLSKTGTKKSEPSEVSSTGKTKVSLEKSPNKSQFYDNEEMDNQNGSISSQSSKKSKSSKACVIV